MGHYASEMSSEWDRMIDKQIAQCAERGGDEREIHAATFEHLLREHEVVVSWDDWSDPTFQCMCGVSLMVEGKSWWSVYVSHFPQEES